MLRPHLHGFARLRGRQAGTRRRGGDLDPRPGCDARGTLGPVRRAASPACLAGAVAGRLGRALQSLLRANGEVGPAGRRLVPAFACAHRGLSGEKAENTLASFGAAVTAGFPAIEMDLRCTADGEVVVLHDAGIERTTDGRGRVDSMTWRELQDY